jgi:hypothetical protein
LIWLRFFRARLLLTAISNLTVGACAGIEGLDAFLWPRFGFLCILASLLYCFGMGSNDFRDRERDRRLHPERPLPSGALSVSAARLVLAVLLLAAFALAAWIGLPSLAVTAALVGCVVLYNRVVKDHALLGPLTMGSVRACLIVLGGTIHPDGSPFTVPVLVAAAVTGGMVSLLTFYSLEEETARLPVLRSRFRGVLLWLAFGAALVGLTATRSWTAFAVGWSIVFTWMLGIARAPLRQDPPRGAAVTFRLLLGLFPLDMAILLSYDRIMPASFILGLWLMTWRPAPSRAPSES